jgi:hypothetical protein
MRLLNKDTSALYLPSVEADGGKRFPSITLHPKRPELVDNAHADALAKHPSVRERLKRGLIVDADREEALEAAKRAPPGASEQAARELRDLRAENAALRAQLEAATAVSTEKPEKKKS